MVSKSQRRRQLDRRRYERYQQRRSTAAQRSYQRRRIAAAVAGGLVFVAALAALVWWRTSPGQLAADAVADNSPAASGSACAYEPAGQAARDVGTPPADPGNLRGPVSATFVIGGKDVVADLAATKAPCAVNSLRFLAGKGYFDGTPCHRLTTSDTLRVLQCGDPTASGSGGPGYTFADENLDGATYPAGTVAMANSGADTNGSQFFLVYGDSRLPPSYTVLGRITSGLDVLTAIAAAGDDGSTAPGDGKPTQPVTLESVTVSTV